MGNTVPAASINATPNQSAASQSRLLDLAVLDDDFMTAIVRHENADGSRMLSVAGCVQ
jgi:hypothetical protein